MKAKKNNHIADIDSITVDVTYSYNPAFAQSGYMWFANADSLMLSGGLDGVSQNTPTTALNNKSIFRLRILVHVGGDVAPAAAAYAFKL